VQIGEREYVDGAVWSPTNLDAAPALRDTHVLCLAPMAGPLGDVPRTRGVRAAVHTALAIETGALRRRGVLLTVVVPAADADASEPARLKGHRQGLALARAR
jgi:NTE family protein